MSISLGWKHKLKLIKCFCLNSDEPKRKQVMDRVFPDITDWKQKEEKIVQDLFFAIGRATTASCGCCSVKKMLSNADGMFLFLMAIVITLLSAS